MKYVLAILVSFLTLQQMCNTAIVPLHDYSKENKKMEKSDFNYRLPVEYDVSQYDISLTPYFDTGDSKAFTFEGSVKITVQPLNENLTRIVLHQKYLTINESKTVIQSSESKSISINSTTYDEVYEFYTINLNEKLNQTLKYTISMEYTGFLQDDMKGFYKSYYMENNVKKWLASTQFQPVHARKAFPCFDEPRFKAVFNIQITRPTTMSKTLSNMPISSQVNNTDSVTDIFHPTPKMSTYLVAFIVSEFTSPNYDDIPGSSFGVWGRPEAGDQTKYAFEAGKKLVSEMSDYLNISYYKMDGNMKMDQAAIPDFSAGAMENWGLLTYREAYLMFDEQESSVRYKQQVSTILAHEITHMWFGDYVTCHWWSDTWLNEGFARFFQYTLPDMIGEDMDLEDQFLVAQVQTALQFDTSDNSDPLTNVNVNSPTEISDFFGTISYNKGASVITMIKNWIGQDTFQKGLHYYLDSRKYQDSEPIYLFDNLQKAADEDKSIEQYGLTVKQVMESWTLSSGYPLLYVQVNMTSGDFTITQSRFKREESAQKDTLYNIPITFITEEELNFNDTKPSFILTEKTKTYNKGSTTHGWVMLNKKAKGYYRVNYDDHSWDHIKSYLEENRVKVHRLNRGQIVDDLFNLAREGYITYTKMYSVLEFLAEEVDYAPWNAAFAGFSFLRSRFAQENETVQLIERHMMNLMETVVKHLGLEENSSDTHLTKFFRMNTLKLACELGHVQCINSSMTLFKDLKTSNKRVPPNLREFVYCNGLRYGSGEDYDFLWNKYETSNVVNEQIVILGALGCTTQEAKINEFLKKTITPDSSIREQDQISAYNSALSGNAANAAVVLKFVKENTKAMKDTYSSGNLNSAMGSLAGRLSNDQLDELEDFISTSDDLTENEKTSFKSSINSARNNLKWAAANKEKATEWLSSKYNSATSIVLSLSLIMSSLFFVILNNH